MRVKTFLCCCHKRNAGYLPVVRFMKTVTALRVILVQVQKLNEAQLHGKYELNCQLTLSEPGRLLRQRK